MTTRIRSKRLESLVKVYGVHGYNFVQDMGCRPGEVFEFNVVGQVPAAFASKLSDIRKGRVPRRLPALLLEALVIDGHLVAGKYVIDSQPDKPLIVQYTEIMQRHGGPSAPECVSFLGRHKSDRAFQKRVKTLHETWAAR